MVSVKHARRQLLAVVLGDCLPIRKAERHF
jgi:hypothetical protein